MSDQTLKLEIVVDDKGSTKVKTFGKAVGDVGDKAGPTETRLQKVASMAGNLAAKAAVAAGKLAGLAAGLGAVAGAFVAKKSLGEFARFETALTDLGKVTDESLGQIQEKIMELPPALGSATELVKGYYQVISAGVSDPAKALETLTGNAKLAKVAHGDMATMVEGTTTVMDVFETSVGDASDALLTMEKTGKTTVARIVPVIGELAKPAKELGLTLSELGAAFAEVTKTSGGTEKAATGLRAVFVSLMNPTKDMTTLLDSFGGAQQAIKQIGFAGVLDLIRQAAGGNVEKLTDLMGAQEAVLAVMGLLRGESAGYLENLAAQEQRAGALEKAWGEYKSTLSAVWGTFKSTVGKQAILIGQELSPTVKKVVEQTGQWLAANRELITSNVADFVSTITGRVQELGRTWGDFFRAVEGFASVVATVASTAWKAFDRVGTAIGNVAGAVSLLYDDLVSIATDPWEVKTTAAGDAMQRVEDIAKELDKLTGTSWTIEMLTGHNIEEELGGIWGWIKKLTGTEHTVKINADTSGAEASVNFVRKKIESVADTAKWTEQQIEDAWTEYAVDTRPAEASLGDLVVAADATAEHIDYIKPAPGIELTPAMKKILELEKGWTDKAVPRIEKTKPKVDVDTKKAKADINRVGDDWNDVAAAVQKTIKINVDYSSVETAMESIRQSHKEALLVMAHEAAVAMADIESYKKAGIASMDQLTGKTQRVLVESIAQQRDYYTQVERSFKHFADTIDSTPINMKFQGTGSTTTWLGEKIEEMKGKLGEFAATADGLDPEVVVAIKGAVGATEGPLTEALTDAETQITSFADHVGDMRPAVFVDVKVPKAGRIIDEMLADWEPGGLLGAALDGGYPALGMGSYSAGDYPRMGDAEYATGTGLAGVPETGPYILHKREIVLNQAESDAYRRGEGGGGITININPGVMMGNKQDARNLARMIRDELRELGVRGA